MIESSKYLNVKNRNIYLRIFLPETSPLAIVQLNHGLAEHGERYREFALFLCQKGYGLYIHDHPGHGKSVADTSELGHIPWKNGWNLMLSCINQVNKQIRKEHPQTPVFLMGHSMGSILSRHYNVIYPMYFNGMIISGTTNPGITNLNLTLFIVRAYAIFAKSSKKPGWLNHMFYNGYNRSYNNPGSKYEWLSTDPDQVNKYVNDPFCGFNLSLGFFKNLLSGTLQMLRSEKNLKFRKSFPTLIISGKDDPVGNCGKDPKIMKEKYINQGYTQTTLILLDGRHELLNEQNKETVYSTIEEWISKKIPA